MWKLYRRHSVQSDGFRSGLRLSTSSQFSKLDLDFVLASCLRFVVVRWQYWKAVMPNLGMDMAMFEAKTAAVELLRHCRFEMVPGQEITYGDKITLDIKSNGKEEFFVHVRGWPA